jgi:hypothetical protein
MPDDFPLLLCYLSNPSIFYSISEDSTVGYHLAYRKDMATSPSNNGNAVILQVAFSYDTLVESKELFSDTYEEDEDEPQDNNLISVSDMAQDMEAKEDTPRGRDLSIGGYFGSAVEILGLWDEIGAVDVAFQRQREIDKADGKGKSGKRRVYRG